MNINEIVKIQEGVKRISQDNKVGKKIVENAEYNVINELMGKIKGKKGKKGQSQAEKALLSSTQTNPAYNLSLSGNPPPPNWDNGFWTKRTPTMTDEEMEEKMAELGREFAERSVEIGNSGKSSSMINRQLKNLRDEFEFRKADVISMYISVVSPDRKAAYASANLKESYTIYGTEKNVLGGNELMRWNPSDNSWSPWMTEAEGARLKKMYNIFSDTILAYEAEHKLKIPHTTISNSWVV